MRQLFPSQLESETIHLVVREHWVKLAQKTLVWLLLAAALAVFQQLAPSKIPFLFEDPALQYTILFTQVYMLFLIVSLFLIWIMHYLNIQIITDLRIVDITQSGLFSHTVSELHIDKIEDVTSEVDGIFGTIFDFGDVYVQTAGTKERFEFNQVPHPGQIEKLILGMYEKNSNFAVEGNESDPKQLDHV